MSSIKTTFPTEEDFEAAAWLLRCDVAAILAVAEVESGPYGAFNFEVDGQPPVILFERHKFDRHTDGKYRGFTFSDNPTHKKYAIISWPSWGGYGPLSVQHDKLSAAVKLNREAALKSCSWGLFQILGENHRQCGYDSVQRMVNAAYRSVQDHLIMFTIFIRSDSRLVDAIRKPDFKTFKRVYNGPSENGYEVKMEKSYRKYKKVLPW